MEDVILVNDKTQYGQDALSLAKDNMILKVDFTDMLKRTSHNRIYSELLVKAVGKKLLCEDTLVLDATAGLGEDAFILASAGLKV